MKINRVKVTGKLGFDLTFSNRNIILGENGTGKSTFTKLLLYSLGADFDTFIPEISKEKKCDAVNTYISFSNGKEYVAIRKLPSSDIVTVGEIISGEINKDSLTIQSLSEYSEFILSNEGLPITSISYGDEKNASMRFYFYLRGLYVDQETPAYKVLSDIGGAAKEFLNSQSQIRKAIIQMILGAQFSEMYKLRNKLQEIQKNEQLKKSELSSVLSILNTLLPEETINKKSLEKFKTRLKEIQDSKKKLGDNYAKFSKYESNFTIEQSNNLKRIEKNISILLSKDRELTLQIADMNNAKNNIKEEIKEISELFIAKDLILQMPIERCPVCLSNMHPLKKSEKNECPYCHSETNNDNYEDGLAFKRMLEEALIEASELESKLKKERQNNQEKIDNSQKELLGIKKEIQSSMNSSQADKDYLILKNQLELYIKEENKLSTTLDLLKKRNSLKFDLEKIAKEKKELSEEIVSLETEIDKKLNAGKKNWKLIGLEYLKRVFPQSTTFDFDDMYNPILDDFNIRDISSASLKVAVRIIYIVSLFHLKEQRKINHPGFVVLDSPRDKDLDSGRYKKILDILYEQKNQFFLTGSLHDEKLYDKKNILIKLTEDSRLLSEN
ncbi:hypothetical protein EHQ92_18065 [Leptospira biflexa]|uniref:hypothetical protein n=1 Tax=Leptospira biflexa TaxID=172 RepID=UPI001090F20F|nr:hypothetical protein [Leptospira biflexa]TGM41704.1 hypothetical protein EHQ92_18065 [Leptospira biflexa]TGM43883.1 hypothetical protein EHQ88_18095 [Leptospira biflexa]